MEKIGMDIGMAVIYGVIWSLLWIIFIGILLFKYPKAMEHDFPEDIKEKAKLPDMDRKTSRQAMLVTVISYVILSAFAIWSGVSTFSSAPISFFSLLGHEWILCQMWNVIDLLLVDWLVVCFFTPKWILFHFPGTEDCKGWKDYGFHLKGFLHGLVYISIFALVYAGICYGILKYFIW